MISAISAKTPMVIKSMLKQTCCPILPKTVSKIYSTLPKQILRNKKTCHVEEEKKTKNNQYPEKSLIVTLLYKMISFATVLDHNNKKDCSYQGEALNVMTAF